MSAGDLLKPGRGQEAGPDTDANLWSRASTLNTLDPSHENTSRPSTAYNTPQAFRTPEQGHTPPPHSNDDEAVERKVEEGEREVAGEKHVAQTELVGEVRIKIEEDKVEGEEGGVENVRSSNQQHSLVEAQGKSPPSAETEEVLANGRVVANGPSTVTIGQRTDLRAAEEGSCHPPFSINFNPTSQEMLEYSDEMPPIHHLHVQEKGNAISNGIRKILGIGDGGATRRTESRSSEEDRAAGLGTLEDSSHEGYTPKGSHKSSPLLKRQVFSGHSGGLTGDPVVNGRVPTVESEEGERGEREVGGRLDGLRPGSLSLTSQQRQTSFEEFHSPMAGTHMGASVRLVNTMPAKKVLTSKRLETRRALANLIEHG